MTPNNWIFKKLIANVILLGGLTQNSGFSAFLLKAESCHARSAISSRDNGQRQSGSCTPAELTCVSHSHPGQLLALMWPDWLQGLWGWTHDINRAHRVSRVKRELEEIIGWTKAIGFVYYTPPASTSKKKAWYSSGLFTWERTGKHIIKESFHVLRRWAKTLVQVLAWSSSFKRDVRAERPSTGHHSCQRLM